MKKRMLSALCLLALLAGVLVLPPSAGADYVLQVGFGRRDMTPEGSVPLAGYGNTFTRLSKADDEGNTVRMDDNGDGVVDEKDGLFATCIAFRDSEGQTMLWFAVDMTGASSGVLSKLQRRITAKWGIPSRFVLLNASHTHSGVDLGGYTSYITGSAEEDPDRPGYDADTLKASYYDLSEENRAACDRTRQFLYERLLPGLMGAAEDALADLAPAEMRTGSIRAPGLNFLRHYYASESGDDPADVYGDNTTGYSDFLRPYGDANDTMYLVEFEREGKTPIVAVDWRAHPKLNSTATSTWGLAHRAYVSSDYVNAFRYTLEQAGYLPVFFEGTAGDVNTFSDLYIKSKAPNYLADEDNPTDKDTVLIYTNGTSTKASQIGYLYGQKLASWALQGLSQNMTDAPVGPLNGLQKAVSAPRDTHENYKMIGNDDVEGMLYEIVTDSKGAEYNVYDYLQKYYAYVTVPSKERKQVNSLLSKYGINSVYHLGRINSKFTNTMQSDGQGGYVQKSDIQGSFELHAYSIGSSVACVTAPFEIFDAPYTFRGEKFPTTFVLGYSNGTDGYMPTEDTYTFAQGRGCYEANNTAYAPGTAELIAEEHRQLLEGIDRLDNSDLPQVCPHCGVPVVWQPLDNSYEMPGGHYYLPMDTVGRLTQMNIRSGVRVCLHLNGHKLVNTGTSTSRLFATFSGGELNIMGDGVMQSQGAKISLDANGKPVSSPYQGSGLIHINTNSTVNIYGGTLQLLAAPNQWAYVGGIFVIHGTVNMYGGTLTTVDPNGVGPATQTGGLAYVGSKGTFRMTGGLVTGGRVIPGGTGANVDAASGGRILLGGTAQVDGGVHLAGGVSMTLSDQAKVLADGIQAEENAALIDAAAIAEGAEIHVSTAAVPQAFATVPSADQAALFRDVNGGRIVYQNGVLSTAAALPPGDLTGDEKVNGKDVTMLQRWLAGGYGVTLDDSAADVNRDGKVNGKDVTMLQRFVVGGYGVEL